MSIQVVSNFIKKNADKRMTRDLPGIKKPLKECLLDLQKYINDTVKEYLGTNIYDDLKVAEWIYKDTIIKSEEETYAKISLFAARKSLNNIVDEISANKGGLSFNNIKRYRQRILDLLHDISGFIDYYRRRTDPKICISFRV